MKKFYIAASLFLAIFSQADAQVLNQSAGWPNTAWTVTGTYSEGETTFEADPTTSENFAFDDDDAGFGSDDDIAAESPVIDLSAAFAAGEKGLQVSVQYAYNFHTGSVLQFQYWDAAASVWTAWPGGTLAESNDSIYDDYCSSEKVDYTTSALNIGDFSTAQLTGFKYRISYDDMIDGPGYGYGFCFSAPTITSLSCFAPSEGVALVTSSTTATLTWNSGGAENSEVAILLEGSEAPDTANNTGVNVAGSSYLATGLLPATNYVFYVRSECTLDSEFSTWSGPFSFNTVVVPGCSTPVSPADGATDIPTGNVTFEWTVPTTGDAATSYDLYYGLSEDAVTSFVGNYETTSALITLTGNSTEFFWRIVPMNEGGESTACDDVIWSFTTEAAAPAPENDDCSSAIALTVGSSFDEGALTTTSVSASVGELVPSCQGNVNGDVWFTVTVPSDGNLVLETGAVEGSSNTDTVLVAYSGTCDSLTAIECDDDDSTAGNFSLLTLSGLTAGETLYVQALQYGLNAARGEFQVSAYSTTLATSAFSQNAFKAYPNPVKDVLNLSYYKNISSVTVYNLLGQEVFAKSVNANSDQINLSSLSSGNYLVKIASDNEVKTIKVVKE